MIWRQVIPLWLVLLVGMPVLAGCLAAAVRRSTVTWLRRALLVAVAAVIARTPAEVVTQPSSGAVAVQMFFVVDRTGSMAAKDWGPGPELSPASGAEPTVSRRRLDGARLDIVSLTGDIPGASYSVIGFAGEAGTQLPLTGDRTAVRAWAETVTQEVTGSSTGTLTDRPLAILQRVLEDAAKREPKSVRLVFFLSDGEQTAEGEPASFAPLAGLIDGGAVLGYGTEAGGQMRSYDGSYQPDAAWIPDPANGGEPAVSRIDEANLRAIADQLGVRYVHRAGPGPTADLVAGIDPEAIAGDGRGDIRSTRDLVWPWALGAGVLLLWEAAAWAFAGSRPRLRRGGAG
ncbi:MAG: VWA domain-containing protein [Actinomycetales bacterium]|nr:VWA domain-containing protein [Actinomycetales bacterium]